MSLLDDTREETLHNVVFSICYSVPCTRDLGLWVESAAIALASWDHEVAGQVSSDISRFFPGKHLIHFLVLKMKAFRNFVLDNCILDFDAEQVYFLSKPF